jgi:hypothetical protein
VRRARGESLSREIRSCRQQSRSGLCPRQTFSRQELAGLTETGSTADRDGFVPAGHRDRRVRARCDARAPVPRSARRERRVDRAALDSPILEAQPPPSLPWRSSSRSGGRTRSGGRSRRRSERGFSRRRLGVGRHDDRFHDWLDPFGGYEDGDRRAPDQYFEDSPTSGVAVAHWNSPVPNRIDVPCCLITE